MSSDGGAWPTDPSAAFKTYFVPQGISADLIATKFGFSRADVDAFAVESQKRTANCLGQRLLRQIRYPGEGSARPDSARQGRASAPRNDDADARRASIPRSRRWARWPASMPSRFKRYPEVEAINHVHTAGNSSGIVDGAAGVLVGSKRMARGIGKSPRAKIRGDRLNRLRADNHADRAGMGCRESLEEGRHGAKNDIDLWELNEAFASVVLRFMQAFDMSARQINVNGGAIAMGHPLGATGAMILGTVLDELERRNLNTALVNLCVGAGMGTATIIERV